MWLLILWLYLYKSKKEDNMNEKEVQEMAADVVAIVKREREAQASKYGSLMESIVGAIQNDPRCREKRGGNR